MPYTTSAFFVGLDLGQANDPSALCAIEKITHHYTADERFYHGYHPPKVPPRYAIRHLHRFLLQTPYPQIISDVTALLKRPELRPHCTLVIDATGCGRPVLDMFLKARLSCPVYGILITGGDTVNRCGYNIYRVPKRDLVAVTNVLLQNKQLDIVPTLREADLLTKELLAFRVKQDPLTGHDAYGEWRAGHHDDMVLATSIGLWFGERGMGFPAALAEVEGL